MLLIKYMNYSNVIQNLRNRATDVRGSRMPSLRAVHELLVSLNVEHYFGSSSNVVSRRLSNGRSATVRYGATGNVLRVEGLELDNSESYYSANTWQYARNLVSLLEERGLI